MVGIWNVKILGKIPLGSLLLVIGQKFFDHEFFDYEFFSPRIFHSTNFSHHEFFTPRIFHFTNFSLHEFFNHEFFTYEFFSPLPPCTLLSHLCAHTAGILGVAVNKEQNSEQNWEHFCFCASN